ncbi:MAG: thiamine pyrophosphate-binding protein [Flavobacteriaceae bacterium]
MIRGHQLLAKALKQQGVDTMFFLMGGPNIDAARSITELGMKMIDVRHEQSAAMMAQAYARLRNRPGVCMAASGPGTINLITGVATAMADATPLVVFGGSGAIRTYDLGSFQDVDQVAMMKPVTKLALRVYETRRIPEYVDRAFRQAMAGKPGPVYLDFPGDILHQGVPEEDVVWPRRIEEAQIDRPAASPKALDKAVAMLGEAEKPVIITGSGIIWSKAYDQLRDFVETAGVPFYTTPQGRGVIPEDHEYFYGRARSTALREADVVVVAGTRLNYMFGTGRAPRFSKNARFIRIDVDPLEVASNDPVELVMIGDAGTVLDQLTDRIRNSGLKERYAPWRKQLADYDASRAGAQEEQMSTNQTPIHPLRLCKEVRDFLKRDSVLSVDGQEILNYGRQSIPTYTPGHRMNSGTFGTMGVGLPFGIGAKAACPEKEVVVLHGDGSFGMNAMELDTADRHGLPVLVIISLNGGWTADPNQEKVGRNLRYTRYDKIAEELGCHGEFVQKPEDIRPALDRARKAVEGGRSAVVNVETDWAALAKTLDFTAYRT